MLGKNAAQEAIFVKTSGTRLVLMAFSRPRVHTNPSAGILFYLYSRQPIPSLLVAQLALKSFQILSEEAGAQVVQGREISGVSKSSESWTQTAASPQRAQGRP